MSHIERTIRIDASPATVWDVLAGVERWPEWTASVRRVEPLDGGPLAEGRSFRVATKGAPTAVWRVTDLAPGRSFTWETSSGVSISAAHVIEPDGAGSMVTLLIRTRGVLAALFSPLIAAASRRNMDLEAEGLKRRSEERARS